MKHQLGCSFRAGVMAALIGAVVVGGCAVFATVALWLFPALRQVDRPDEA